MLAQVGTIRLAKGKLYEFSCRAREENLAGRSVNVAISDTTVLQNCGLYRTMTLGPKWCPIRWIFRASRASAKTRLQLWYAEPGTLCIDDVKIVELSETNVAFTDTIPPAAGKNLVYKRIVRTRHDGMVIAGRKSRMGQLGPSLRLDRQGRPGAWRLLPAHPDHRSTHVDVRLSVSVVVHSDKSSPPRSAGFPLKSARPTLSPATCGPVPMA